MFLKLLQTALKKIVLPRLWKRRGKRKVFGIIQLHDSKYLVLNIVKKMPIKHRYDAFEK